LFKIILFSKNIESNRDKKKIDNDDFKFQLNTKMNQDSEEDSITKKYASKFKDMYKTINSSNNISVKKSCINNYQTITNPIKSSFSTNLLDYNKSEDKSAFNIPNQKPNQVKNDDFVSFANEAKFTTRGKFREINIIR